MPMSPEQREEFVRLVRELTPGQLSTLIASLGEPGSQIGTSRSSANYRLLQALCDWGMAEAVPIDADMPPAIRAAVASFAVRDESRAELARLLDEAAG